MGSNSVRGPICEFFLLEDAETKIALLTEEQRETMRAHSDPASCRLDGVPLPAELTFRKLDETAKDAR